MTRHRLLHRHGFRSGTIVVAMLLLALSSLSAQQASQTTPIFRQSNRAVNGGQVSLLSVNRALSLDVNIAAFRAAAAPSMEISDVPLAPGLSVDLQLEEWNIIEPGAYMVFGTATGDVPIKLTARFYKGKVKGDEKSDVFLSFSDKGVLGHVRTFDKSYEISTDNDVKQDGSIVPALSYPTDALPNKMVNCGLNEQNMPELASPQYYDYEKMLESRTNAPAVAADIEFAVVGAWEADVEYLALFGGNQQAAADYAAQLIADVSSVYERDLGAQLTIGHMKIWTDKGATGYPYKEGTNMSVALRETRDYWRKHDEVTRAFVHTLSGKGWVNPIGIAFLDVLCDNGRAGSFSAITRTDAARDRRVVAHEIGHNFNSPHTHDCSWAIPNGPGAIDHCAPAEGGSCFSTVEQSVGTIMSYCSQSNLEFHPLCVDRMRARLASAPCNTSQLASARKLLIAPNLVVFADVELNKPRDTIFTGFFRNIGFGEIHVTGVERSGENNDQFEIIEGGTVPFTIGPGDSAVIKVHYKASTTEPAELKLTYTHDGFNPPVDVTFEGYATDAAPVLAFFGAEEDKIEWGERFQGLPHDTTVTVKNFGQGSSVNPAVLYVTDTRIEGQDKLDFQIVDGSAPFQLRGLEDLEMTIRFKPEGTGDKQAELVVVSNSYGEQGHIDRLPLFGSSKVGPVMQLGIHDLVVDFGDVPQGSNSVERRFDKFLTNVGGAILQYTAVMQITEGESQVLLSSNTGVNTELEPGQSHSLVITFDPKPNGNNASTGLKRGYLAITSTDYDTETFEISNDTVHIVGNIVAPSAVPDDLQPDDFFYVTTNPSTGSDLSFYLAPRDGEQNDLYILSVLDLQGREVYRHVNRFGQEGEFHHLNAADFASGAYYIRVSTTQGIRARKTTIAR